MNEADFEQVEKILKHERAEQKALREKCAYPITSIQGAYLDGKIAGLTKALVYFCRDPYED